MPHLLLERVRTELFTTRKEYPCVAYFVEALDILAGGIFLWGSVCFLPRYSYDLTVFLWGCFLFVLGSAIYLVITAFTMCEGLCERGWKNFEFLENIMYVVGSWFFFSGTVLYWPEKSQYENILTVQEFSLGQYFNLFSPEFEGTVLFIAGSLLFALAAFTNALNHRKFEEDLGSMLSAITSLYMLGALLFVVGSIAFLPDLGCSDVMLNIGATCFIGGSCFYLVGSVLSLVRTDLMMRRQEVHGLMKDSETGNACRPNH